MNTYRLISSSRTETQRCGDPLNVACILKTADNGSRKVIWIGSRPAFPYLTEMCTLSWQHGLGTRCYSWPALICAHCECRSRGLWGWKQRSLCQSDNVSVCARLKPLSEFRKCSKITCGWWAGFLQTLFTEVGVTSEILSLISYRYRKFLGL